MIYFNFLYNFRIATESTCKFLMVFCMNLKKKRLKTKFGEVRDTEEFIEQRKIEKQVNTVKQSNRLKLVSSFLISVSKQKSLMSIIWFRLCESYKIE